MENTILINFTKRLGQEVPVLRKAEEYLRVLQKKAILNTNDVAKIVICIDLAARAIGAPFDKTTAIQLSGLRKSKYENILNTSEKLLGLNKIVTISEVCVQFNCTEVKETADLILAKYKEKGINDLSHPQYVAAAVFAACKTHQVPVNKAKFVSISRLKPSQWKTLEEEFLRIVETLGFPVNKTNKKNNLNKIEMLASKKVFEYEMHKKSEEKENEIEDYEVWKRRILNEAQEALKT